jgi:hypothetical protein
MESLYGEILKLGNLSVRALYPSQGKIPRAASSSWLLALPRKHQYKKK